MHFITTEIISHSILMTSVELKASMVRDNDQFIIYHYNKLSLIINDCESFLILII